MWKIVKGKSDVGHKKNIWEGERDQGREYNLKI